MFAGIPITAKHTKYSDIKHDAAPKAMSKLDRDFGSKKKSSSRSEKCVKNLNPFDLESLGVVRAVALAATGDIGQGRARGQGHDAHDQVHDRARRATEKDGAGAGKSEINLKRSDDDS